MTTMRVTVGSYAFTATDAINKTSSALAKAQSQMSSGKQIQTPSDDPMGTVTALALRGQISRNTQYATNANDAQAWLSAGDTAYSQIVNALQQARTLVVKGLNSGANDAAAQQTLAQEVSGVRSSLLSLANTSYNGRPIFGGTTASGVAYDPSGAYVGDTGTVTRQIGDNDAVQVSSTGPAVFGSGSSDVFSLLSTISTALNAGNGSLSNSSLSALDDAISRVSSAQAVAGAITDHVDQAQTQQTANSTAMTTQLSSIEDVDMAQMAIKVTTANTAYQAALQTTASIRQLSLLDFLR
jgi:flagellar hook-associated protein 3 FlgL